MVVFNPQVIKYMMNSLLAQTLMQGFKQRWELISNSVIHPRHGGRAWPSSYVGRESRAPPARCQDEMFYDTVSMYCFSTVRVLGLHAFNKAELLIKLFAWVCIRAGRHAHFQCVIQSYCAK